MLTEQQTNWPANQVAVVTGAGSGVGAAIAQALAGRGFTVALLGRTAAKLTTVEDEIRRAGGSAEIFTCDVSEPDQVESVSAALTQRLGQPQVVVNNAGLHCELAPIAATTPAQWIETMQVNVVGPYLISRAFMSGMMAQGWGRIVNVSSAASLGEPGNIGAIYQLSKVTLNHFTRQLAVEVEGTGVTANAIHPGEVKTAMWAAIKADAESRSGSGQDALNWATMVEESGGDPPQKAADLVLAMLGRDYDDVNGRFLWIEDGIKAPMPSW